MSSASPFASASSIRWSVLMDRCAACGDVVSRIMNFGAPTPIEVGMSGPNLGVNRTYAEKVRVQMSQISSLRDLQYGQPLDYPSLIVNVDRDKNPDGTQPPGQTPECRRPARKKRRSIGSEIMQKTDSMMS